MLVRNLATLFTLLATIVAAHGTPLKKGAMIEFTQDQPARATDCDPYVGRVYFWCSTGTYKWLPPVIVPAGTVAKVTSVKQTHEGCKVAFTKQECAVGCRRAMWLDQCRGENFEILPPKSNRPPAPKFYEDEGW